MMLTPYSEDVNTTLISCQYYIYSRSTQYSQDVNTIFITCQYNIHVMLAQYL
jgi:hypothetical protein